MSLRRLLIYGLILAGVGLYYAYEHRQAGQERKQEQQHRQVFDLQEADIDSLVLHSASRDDLVLERHASLWQIVRPRPYAADQGRVEALLRQILRTEAQRSLEAPADGEPFGLDTPALEMIFTAGQEEYRLTLGQETPTRQYVYARSSTRGEIFLVNGYLLSALDKDLFSLRDKRLITLDYATIERVRIVRGARELSFARSEEGRWRLEGDTESVLKEARLDALLMRLSQLEARSFPEDATLKHGPAPVSITLEGGGASQSLSIWDLREDGEGQLIVARSSVLDEPCEVTEDILQVIPRGLKDVLDRSILRIDPDRIRRISLIDKDHKIRFMRKDDAWEGEGGAQPETWRVQSLIMAVEDLEYDSALQAIPPEYGTERGVSIWYDGEDPAHELWFNGDGYVKTAGSCYRIERDGMMRFMDAWDILVNAPAGSD